MYHHISHLVPNRFSSFPSSFHHLPFFYRDQKVYHLSSKKGREFFVFDCIVCTFVHWVELSDIVRKLDYVESYPLGNFLVTCLLHQVRLLIEAEIQGELEKLGHFYF